MMWFKILKFEIAYRKKRPATYLYFAIIFFISLLAGFSDLVESAGGTGLVKENAPVTIANMMLLISTFFMMVTSAVMGVGILRDFEHQMDSLIFSTPIKKFDYLFGRFSGSFLIVVLIFSGSLLGFIIGDFMPWRNTDRLLDFNLWSYVHPFFYLVIPNLLFTSILFFFTGAITRNVMVVYLQWIFLLVFYLIGVNLSGEIEHRDLAAIIDPFALTTVKVVTNYWTVAEQNSRLLPIAGLILYNRLLWVGISLIIGFIGYSIFTFDKVRKSFLKKKKIESTNEAKTNVKLPEVSIASGFRFTLKQVVVQSLFYFRQVLKSFTFQAIVVAGFALMIINSFSIESVFGVSTYPTTYLMVKMITNGFAFLFIIIVVIYSGELIWKERDLKFNLLHDTLPVSEAVTLVSKFFGLVMTYIVLILLLILFGVTVQTFKGYYEYDLNVYFIGLFSQTFSFLVLFTMLSFFIMVIVNHKFLGYVVIVLFFILNAAGLSSLGLEHRLFYFASADLGLYSDMNEYGHFFSSFGWFTLYSAGFASLLFGLAILFSSRGIESNFTKRLKVSRYRLTKPMLIFFFLALTVFLISGSFIFYNTNILNTYRSSQEIKMLQANYEKDLGKYQYFPQPKISSINLQVDLYPYQRDYKAEGSYKLINMDDHPIRDIHVQLNVSNGYGYNYLRFDREARIKEEFEDYKFVIYELSEALAPGDSMLFMFETFFETKGFVEGEENTEIVYNGTFFNNSDFPGIGYNHNLELDSDIERKEYGLEPKERMLPRDDPRGLTATYVSDSHGVDFEIVISTAHDQIALAPGYLQREWKENSRNYYHYKMDEKMLPFFNIVSARYEVLKDEMVIDTDTAQKKVKLEIYYHKGHEYNLQSMMKGMKKSISYYSKNFTPYQYRQMRILEYPRYASFAQSFANTVPFSEAVGFVLDIKDGQEVDLAFRLTAHEMAHQWWGHQLYPANVQGSAVLTETLSQYSALMVMKNEFPIEHIRKSLKEELDNYLEGRATEKKKEMPLALVEDQGYIHYGKGALVMYALQDYIGEEKVNKALRNLLHDWSDFKTHGRYPTTIELVEYLRDVTPDSLQYIITDMFDNIILYENKVQQAVYEKVEGNFIVELTIEALKLRSDGQGNTSKIPINDWVDIGIYGLDQSGEEKLIYLEKHKISDENETIKLSLDSKPVKAGIDPLYKLIDQTPSDNLILVKSLN